MFNKITILLNKNILILYIMLAGVTLAVYWQVSQFDFVHYDDTVYVTQNTHIRSGFTLEGLRWAFGTTYAEFWHPLTWLSLMADYQLFGLNAGGYHMTNVIFHLLATLMLFGLFHRMTQDIWKSAFVAGFFALHPLHVESVAWIAERKDVLSAFFWMLTLYLYVYYTEKPGLKRYALVLCAFVLALMSKPMVVTLPVIMILLDYWPLKRLHDLRAKTFIRQLKEKLPLLALSATFSLITLKVQPSAEHFPFLARLSNAPVAFVTYLEKTLWPRDLAVFYPFDAYLPLWQVVGALLLIALITIVAMATAKRLPYLFVGWFWFTIAIAPVIGIIQVGKHAMADRYHYLPSVGLAVIMAWGLPSLLKNKNVNKILFPAGMIFLAGMAFITWKQAGWWKNDFELFNHAVEATQNNYIAYNHRGVIFGKQGNYQLAMKDFNAAIQSNPAYAMPHYNMGKVYTNLGQHGLAISNYNQAILLQPDFAEAYYNKGIIHDTLGEYVKATELYNKAIALKPNFTNAYNNRAIAFFRLGKIHLGCPDAQKACELGKCNAWEWANTKKYCR